MNTKLLLIVGGVLVIAVIAFVVYRNSSSNPLTENNTQMNVDEVADTVMNAFNGSGSVKCTYQNDSTQGITYIKNGMIRVESTGGENDSMGNVIMKNDTLWGWEANSTEGFMMENISKYQDDESVPDDYKLNSENVRAQISENQGKCNNENISDSMFDPPANVKFQNYSSMMEEIKKDLPEGIELPEGYEMPSN